MALEDYLDVIDDFREAVPPCGEWVTDLRRQAAVDSFEGVI
jgi:hypothetical protein